MTKLTDKQIALLRAAADAPDGLIEPATDKPVANALIRRALMIVSTRDDEPRRLFVTGAGRAALEPPAEDGQTSADEVTTTERATPKGKLGQLIDLLRRPTGASVDEMMEATGWQAHSVRGAMSGALKKGQGLAIESEKSGNARVYRIVDGVAQ